MTGMGAIYGHSAENGGILHRFNSGGAYGHKVVGNTNSISTPVFNRLAASGWVSQ